MASLLLCGGGQGNDTNDSKSGKPNTLPEDPDAWPPESKEAYEERFAIIMEGGDVSEEQARRLAAEMVKKQAMTQDGEADAANA